MSQVSFRALFGHRNNGGPVSHLLKVEGCTILLDCGWNEDFDPTLLEPLREVCPIVNVVLVSHSDVYHMGGLVYAFKHFGLNAPVYGTLPALKMGEMFLFDAFVNKENRTNEFSTFSLEDVDSVVEKFITVKYSQTIRIAPFDVPVTPFSAGRSLGGAVWQINEDIVYAVNFNHRRERMLDGSAIIRLEKPAVLITDALSAFQEAVKVEDREKKLAESVASAFAVGGNVLIPCDVAGRSLELLLYLNRWWEVNNFSGRYSLVFLHSHAVRTIDLAKSELEWMSAQMVDFDARGQNPFDLKCVMFFHSLEELFRQPLAQPMCVLATSESLNVGPALDLFLLWCQHPSNLILFMNEGPPDSRARKILQVKNLVRKESANADPNSHADSTQSTSSQMKMEDEDSVNALPAGSDSGIVANPDDSFDIYIDTIIKVPLEGDDLVAWREEQRAVLEAERQREIEERERKKLIILRDVEAQQQKMEEDRHYKKGEDVHMKSATKGGVKTRAAKDEEGQIDMEDDLDGDGDGDEEADEEGDGDEETEDERAKLDRYKNNPRLFLPSNMRYNSVYPMFPHIPEDILSGRRPMLLQTANSTIVDDPVYGSVIDSTFFVSALNAQNEDQRSGGARTGADDKAEWSDVEIEAKLDKLPVPKKGHPLQQNLRAVCRVDFVDYSARPDALSVKRIITQRLAARRVVLVHGSPEQIRSMGDSIARSAAVTVPDTSDWIDLEVDSTVISVRLREDLLESMRWVPLQNVEAAFLEGKLQPLPDGAGYAIAPQTTGHMSIYVGDLKMADLKSILQQAGFQSDLRAGSGTLICAGGRVQIRKSSATTVIVESSLCREYYGIRSVLYSQFVTL
eukprot:ANDGO_06425.mRNA.1 Cleavage and polyadenylation specificity factor subunit 2